MNTARTTTGALWLRWILSSEDIDWTQTLNRVQQLINQNLNEEFLPHLPLVLLQRASSSLALADASARLRSCASA